MADNVLIKLTHHIPVSTDYDLLKEALRDMFDGLETIYSYIVYMHYTDDVKDEWIVDYLLSETERYNTLCVPTVIEEILVIFVKSQDESCKRVLGYKQPDIDIMIEAFDPLVHKLAVQEGNKWRNLDHDDLCQICRLEMLKLYNKGYYIHKRLLQKTFSNRVLVNLRHERNAPSIISFEDTFYRPMKSDSEALCFADTIEDTSITEREDAEWQREVELKIFNEVKDIVVDLIGERRWNELVRDYGNKTASTASRRQMNKLKTYFQKLGLTRKEFENKYYG